MQKLFIFCALVCCIYTTNAQDCNITFKGKILDFHNNSPIVDASIHIVNSNKYTTSNLKGEFNFNKLCASTITVEVKHLACETKQVIINLNKDTFKKITLEHHLEELNEISVISETKTERTSIENTLDKEVVFTYTDKSLGDALNTISGVSTLSTGNSIVKPIIHGLHSSRLLIVNNNVRMFDQEWGEEHAPNIDINSGGKISIIKGANTLKYGSDAIGGLILIKPKRFAIKDSVFGNTTTSLNSNGLGGNLNSEIIKTYSSGYYGKLQTSYKRFGDFSAANYNLSNSGLESINASLQFGFNSYIKGFDAYYSFVSNEIGILRAAHVGNVNDLVRAINSGEPSFVDEFSHSIDNPRQSIIHHLGKIEAYKRFRNAIKLSVQYDFQINNRKEFDRRRASFSDIPAADFRLFTTSIQPNLEIKSFKDLEINTGFLLRYQQNSSADENETGISIPLIPDYERYEAGIYATSNLKLNNDLSLSAGFRYDYIRIDAEKKYKLFDWEENNYDVLFPEFTNNRIENFEIFTFPEFNFHNFSTSLGLTKTFKNDFEFIFNYGLASRTPNVAELFSDGLHHSAARIETGSLTLTKEVAYKFIMSFNRNNENFGFSISPYFKHINGFIQLIPSNEALTTIRGAFVAWDYNQVDSRIFGVDIDINKRISNSFNYQGGISILKGDNITDNIPLINMPATNFKNRITYTNKAFNNLSVSLTQRTILQQNRFPDYNFSVFNPIIQDNVLVDISSTPPTYSIFGLQTSAAFKAFKTGSLVVEFNVENIFDLAYREHLNRLRFFADEIGRNYNLKIKINY